MPPTISRIIQALEPSATQAMAAKAKELKAAGETVYDLSLGEPDFVTPPHICQAALEAMEAGLKAHKKGGRPLVNSVSCQADRVDAGLDLVKKYEKGTPDS